MSDISLKVDQLRKRRSQDIENRKQSDLRKDYGARLASIVGEATGIALSIDDFDKDLIAPYTFEWPEEIMDAPGLVAPYVSRLAAVELLGCLDRRLGELSGKIGFHDKNYLGLACIAGVRIGALLSVAENAEDSVIFYLDRPAGTILVDYYRTPPSEPYSVVVQGEALVHMARACFGTKGGTKGDATL